MTKNASQSPENGSQHCKEDFSTEDPLDIMIRSQSPENGSQHCKLAGALEAEGLFPEAVASQSPENGSQHCKPPKDG